MNKQRTRIQRPNTLPSVTGIVVNKRPNIPREMVRSIRAILHAAKSTGLNAQNREEHPHFESWVGGMISYIHMVNPERAAKLKAEFETVKGS